MERCHEQFDFIFADPPYALSELPTIPDKIFEYNLLKEGGLFVLEHGKTLLSKIIRILWNTAIMEA
mgnify:CR=1 FL=1